MKNLVVVFLLLVAYNGFSRNYKVEIPGMVKINDTLYVDKNEISNKNWREYLFWIENTLGRNSIEYKNALPDSSVWLLFPPNGTYYMKYYYRHPDFSSFPIVGINYMQVLNYNKWRQERIREVIGEKIKFTIRLPYKKEWEYIASVGLDLKDYPFGYSEILTKTNELKFLVNENFLINDYNRRFEIENYSSVENYFGCINMIGNVAEMVQEEGIAKGGSWYHSITKAEILKSLYYDKPMFWLGFRNIAILK